MTRSVRRLLWGNSGQRGWVILAVVLATLAYVVRHPGELYVDTRPEVYLRPGQLVMASFSAWAGDGSLGAANFDVGYLPLALVVWLLQALGSPIWLSQRLVRVALFGIAAWGARQFAVKVSDRPLSHPAQWVAALGYASTPFALVGANSIPVMLPMALMPWLLLAFRQCLLPGGWRSVPIFSLLFFAMGGINGGVVNFFILTALPAMVVDLAWRGRISPRHLLRGTALAGTGAVAVSLYWIVGTLLAFGSASTVAGTTESPDSVASTSSYAEVLRGLGGWLTYGADRLGPFLPETTSYITSSAMVVATFLLPVLALVGLWLSTSRIRPMLWVLVLTGAVISVGMYPTYSKTPFGRLLNVMFDNVPGFVAFRTTNKVGPVMVLGLAVLAALAVNAIWRTVDVGGRAILTAALVVGLIVPIMPALKNTFFWSRAQVPGYWNSAAEDLSNRSDVGRVWLIPGEANALYRWRGRGVDDFASALIDRPSFYRRTYPDVPALSANLLSSLDAPLQSDTMRAGTLSVAARYLGAGDILVRNDMRWEPQDGIRPAKLMPQMDADPGLRASAIYGKPGENVQTITDYGLDERSDLMETSLAPLFRYHVTDPGAFVRTESLGGQALIVGDNAGAVAVMGNGRLDGRRPYTLLGSLRPQQATTLLTRNGRLVLTDTNRRINANDRNLSGSGPLLTAHAPLEATRALFTVADQTVARYGVARDVQVSSSGSIFGPQANGRIGLAFDHDRNSSWTFGDFGTAVGNELRVDLGIDRPIPKITLDVQNSAPVRITRAVVSADRTVRTVDLRLGSGVATFPSGFKARHVTVAVTGVKGSGSNQVGFDEIAIGKLDLAEYAEMPQTLNRMMLENADFARAVTKRPLDIVINRAYGMEYETRPVRTWDQVVPRTYRVSGEIQPLTRDRRREIRRHPRQCRSVGFLDGRRVTARLILGARNEAVAFKGCSMVSIDAGPHRFEADAQYYLDQLFFADQLEPSWAPTEQVSRVLNSVAGQTMVQATIGASDIPSTLVLSESYAPGWTATVDGKSLGPAVPADGFALSWWLPPGGERHVVIKYKPQRAYVASMVFSGVSLLFMVSAALLGWSRGRIRTRFGRIRGADDELA